MGKNKIKPRSVRLPEFVERDLQNIMDELEINSNQALTLAVKYWIYQDVQYLPPSQPNYEQTND